MSWRVPTKHALHLTWNDDPLIMYNNNNRWLVKNIMQNTTPVIDSLLCEYGKF